MNPVNSFNEWDPLQEVIVGTARHAADVAYEPSLRPYFPAGHTDSSSSHPVHPALIEAAERQLDAFAETLARRGITVQRPDPIDHTQPYSLPDWQCASGHAAACPRDVLLVVGNEIIEAPMTQRSRYFEYRAYRPLLSRYAQQGARHVIAPKPSMADSLYADCYTSPEKPYVYADTPLLTETEPAFDAACFTRCGRDIFWQPDLVSNQLGADWLAHHLGADFRIHRIEFLEPLPVHIDTTLVPVRPGIVLTNPHRPCTNGKLQLFRDNDWQIVEAPISVRSGQHARDVSNWISMNILMLDPHTCIVEQAETPMIDLMRSLGCEVIPCAFDTVYAFGGGPHCCTTDVRRDGALASYFPTLDR